MSGQLLTSRAIIGTFYKRLAATSAGWAEDISFYQESDQASEDYSWLGAVPAMQEFNGGLNAKGLNENQYSIPNVEFEATLEILVKHLRRDKTGQLRVRINELARRAQGHWKALLTDLINKSEATICYDGNYFFDTDHEEGDSGVQSNLITFDISSLPTQHHGSTTAPSTGEFMHVVMGLIEKILSFKDDQGEAMNDDASSFMVMVPANLWGVGKSALGNDVIDGGDNNILKAETENMQIQLVSNPMIVANNAIDVYRTDGDVKPFIRQEEVKPTMAAIAEGSEMEITERKHLYTVEASRGVGHGYWQHAARGKMA